MSGIAEMVYHEFIGHGTRDADGTGVVSHTREVDP